MSSKKNSYVSSISNASFKQLAKNNVKKSIKDYMIYFITLAFGAALLYSFNSIDTVLSKLLNNGFLDAYVNTARGVLALFSIIICVIFGFLITYANNYLMKRRKREFGIYAILGMDKRDINKLMLLENIFIGIFSLAAGLVFGIIASQGISIIAFKMIGLEFSEVGFVISISAIIKTILLFGLVLVLVNKFNKKNIEKYQLIDLVNANVTNEQIVTKSYKTNLIIFISSFALIMGTYTVIKSLSAPNIILIGAAILMIAAGTYLFFLSIADLVMCQLKQRKTLYYKKLTMFTMGQLSSRIKSMSLLITVICMIMFTALITMPFGMGMANYMKQGLGTTTPFDGTVVRYNSTEIDEDGFSLKEIYSDDPFYTNRNYNTIQDEMIASKIPFSTMVANSSEIRVYQFNNLTIDQLTDKVNCDYDYAISVVSLSEYNVMRSLQGLEEINLAEDTFALNGSGEQEDKIIEQMQKEGSALSLTVNQSKLQFSGIVSDVYYYNYNVTTNPITIIVPDKVISGLYPVRTYLNVYYLEANNDYDSMFALSVADYRNYQNVDVHFDSKIVVEGEKIALNVVFAFTSIYMGVILLISAGAILALQLISHATEAKKQFLVLRKIGVKEKDMKQAIFIQVVLIFLLPLLLASMHYIMLSSVLRTLIVELSAVGIMKNILISTMIIVIVYGAYFFLSYWESVNIMLETKKK
ncbi:MAG: ABC transporter permease [bacterium]|nr:ABC transporter permease [bacterium]